MKRLLKTGWMALVVMVLITACEKDEEEGIDNNSVEGIYLGTLSMNETKNASTFTENVTDATAEVMIVGENEIQVNCYSADFDSTFMLNYYEHQDSAFVCYTGELFEEMYGHMLGGGHMMGGGMMSDINVGETEWMHHLNDEHQQGDEHFGGFDMKNQTFTYTIKMMDGNTPYYLSFKGLKK